MVLLLAACAMLYPSGSGLQVRVFAASLRRELLSRPAAGRLWTGRQVNRHRPLLDLTERDNLLVRRHEFHRGASPPTNGNGHLALVLGPGGGCTSHRTSSSSSSVQHRTTAGSPVFGRAPRPGATPLRFQDHEATAVVLPGPRPRGNS